MIVCFHGELLPCPSLATTCACFCGIREIGGGGMLSEIGRLKGWENRVLHRGAHAMQDRDLAESPRGKQRSSGKSYGHFRQPCCDDASTDWDCVQEFDPCDNIFVQSIQTIEELSTFLDEVHLLLSQTMPMPVKLIVIDSIAALFRSDFENTSNDHTKRADWFFKIVTKLKLYAKKFNLVVVTNQGVDYFKIEGAIRGNTVDETNVGHSHALFSSQRRVVPALGLLFSHCLSQRMHMSFLPAVLWVYSSLKCFPKLGHVGCMRRASAYYRSL